ncbi:MAG: hypothetical protein ABJI43_10930 [Roseobacter sp.]
MQFMASPKKNTTKPDDPRQRKTREAIKTSQLVNRLQGFALEGKDGRTGDKIEIDGARLKAIEILLRKSLPDLSAVTISGDEENPLVTKEVGQGAAKVSALLEQLAERSGTSGESSG